MAQRAWIGTSGWSYRHWRKVFYPEDTPQRRWLGFYAEVFPTVEINATFYRLQQPATFVRWASEVPEEFRFAVKASRYLSHVRRLRDPADGLQRLIDSLAPLGPKRGPLLLQLPAPFPPDAALLDAFLAACPQELPVAVEPRDPRWFTADVEATLRRRGAALVWSDYPEAESPRWTTASFLYLRRHGVGLRYGGRYGTRRLRALAAEVGSWSGDVYCYFNNDAAAAATADAAELLKLLAA